MWPSSQWTELKNFSSSFAFGTRRLEVTKYKERPNSRFGISTDTFINKTVDLKDCGCSFLFLEYNIINLVSFCFFSFFFWSNVQVYLFILSLWKIIVAFRKENTLRSWIFQYWGIVIYSSVTMRRSPSIAGNSGRQSMMALRVQDNNKMGLQTPQM